jgi:2-polyprenyl-3-methyl-5-hydroxy-6-metoxy-1,4-benzoquinol methylase
MIRKPYDYKGVSRRELAKRLQTESERANVFHSIFASLVSSARNHLYKSNMAERMAKVGGFVFIPSHDWSVLQRIRKAFLIHERLFPRNQRDKFGRVPPVKFLDCGCGPGNILLLAAGVAETLSICHEVHGLEYDPVAVMMAEAICSPRGIKVQQANILEYEGYENFDIIYFYRPLSDAHKEWEFERRLFSSVKPGTIIIDNSSSIRGGGSVSKLLYDKKYRCSGMLFEGKKFRNLGELAYNDCGPVGWLCQS